MEDANYIKLLGNVHDWNQWREENPYEKINLSKAHFNNVEFIGINFRNVVLREAVFDNCNLFKANLTGADLTSASFRNISFKHTLLNKAKLTKANIYNTRFIQSELTGISFEEAELFDADFTQAELTEVSFEKAKLFGAVFTQVKLSAVSFEEANLFDADFTQAELTEVSFEKAELFDADFNQAELTEVSFKRTTLNGANFSSATFIRAELKQATLNHAFFNGPDFSHSQLNGADFSDTQLNRVDFTQGSLNGANFQKTELKEALFVGAKLHRANFSEALCEKADFRSATLTAACLIDTNLTGANFTGSCLWQTQRAGWKIEAVICDFVYWDKDKKNAVTYAPGVFEKLYAEKYKIQVNYPGGMRKEELVTLEPLIELIQSSQTGVTLRLESISESSDGAIVTIALDTTSKISSEELAQKQAILQKSYERNALLLREKLEAEKNTLQDKIQLLTGFVLTALGSPKYQLNSKEGNFNMIEEKNDQKISQTFNIEGNFQGAAGTNPQAQDLSYNENSQSQQSINFTQAAKEITTVLNQIQGVEQKSSEHYLAIGHLLEAKKAAETNDEKGLKMNLKAAGKSAYEFAKDISASIIANFIYAGMTGK